MTRSIFVLALASVLSAAGPDQVAVREVTAAMESLKQAMIHKDGAATEFLEPHVGGNRRLGGADLRDDRTERGGIE